MWTLICFCPLMFQVRGIKKKDSTRKSPAQPAHSAQNVQDEQSEQAVLNLHQK